MRLIELYIENFGKLSGYKYSFSSGLNVINEENGYGKSTLAAFIKSMLFGLEDTRRMKLEENDRKRYLPWQGGAFGGTLTFAVGGKKYRIERTFAQKAAEDTFILYDCESGKESKDYSENIGEELFGINVDGFERTVFLSERRLAVKNDNKTISAKLSDLVGCDGDVGELDEAVDLLEERRKYYYKKGGSGHISDIRAAISALKIEINDVTRISDGLPEREKDLGDKDEEIRTITARIDELDSKRQTMAHARQYLDKKAAYDSAKNQLNEANAFFKRGVPTDVELREAERCADAYRALKEKVDAQSDATDRCAELEERIDKANGYIDRLKAEGEKKNAKKLYPALLPLAVVLAACGGIIATSVNLIAGIAAIAAGAVTLTIAVANLATVRKNSTDEKLMNDICAMLATEGVSCTTSEEMRAALAGISIKCEGELKLAKDSAKEAEAERERLISLGRERDAFLEGFAVMEGDPYIQIRRAISDRDYLSKKVADIEKNIAYFVKEYGVDTEKLDGGAEVLTPAGMDALKADLVSQLNRLRDEKTLAEREYKRDREEVLRLDELYERQSELDTRLAQSEQRLAVINLTKEHLIKAKDLLTAKYLGKTRTAFAEYMSMIGEENTELFTMDTSFGITKSDGGGSRPTEAYSLGTQDFFALAARLALVETLYEGERPFVMLDDPFAHFDDKRCATALKVLKRISDKNQIIYLTCSKSRAI